MRPRPVYRSTRARFTRCSAYAAAFWASSSGGYWRSGRRWRFWGMGEVAGGLNFKMCVWVVKCGFSRCQSLFAVLLPQPLDRAARIGGLIAARPESREPRSIVCLPRFHLTTMPCQLPHPVGLSEVLRQGSARFQPMPCRLRARKGVEFQPSDESKRRDRRDFDEDAYGRAGVWTRGGLWIVERRGCARAPETSKPQPFCRFRQRFSRCSPA